MHPFDPALRDDPHPWYARLRAEDPVHRTDAGWLVTRHADVRACLSDARLSHWTEATGETPSFLTFVARWFRLMDPRSRSSLHGLARDVVSRGKIERLVPAIRREARERLDRAARTGRLELIGELARPLTLGVAAELLGVPAESRERLDELAGRAMEGLFGAPGAAGSQAIDALASFLVETIRRRGDGPGDDLIAALFEARRRGDAISDGDVVVFCLIFLYAAQENMMSFLGNAALALSSYPEQQAILRARPELMSSAVEELLRFEGPVQMVQLRAGTDLELRGRFIREGEPVLACLASANRDPAQFERPDELDVTRGPTAHLAFGASPLYCMGAALARIEASATISALSSRLSSFERADLSLDWRAAPAVLRGLRSLHLRVHPAD